LEEHECETADRPG